MASVVRINVTPVKGLALHHPDAVELTESGAVDNRRFHLISGGLLFNGKQCGPLVRVVPTVSGDRLTLRFPDGGEVAGTVELGAPVTTDFWGRPVGGAARRGPVVGGAVRVCGRCRTARLHRRAGRRRRRPRRHDRQPRLLRPPR